MKYKVTVKKNVTKKIRTLPRAYIPKIYVAMKGLAENPRPHNCKRLIGSNETYRIRIGVYRIIYSIDNDMLIVDVQKLMHRQDGY